MPINKNAIANNIARYRIMSKISQKELAQITGLNANYISELESKNGKLPSLDALSRIANALNTTVDQILVENLNSFKMDASNHRIYKELPFMSDEQLKILLLFLRVYDESKLKLK